MKLQLYPEAQQGGERKLGDCRGNFGSSLVGLGMGVGDGRDWERSVVVVVEEVSSSSGNRGRRRWWRSGG